MTKLQRIKSFIFGLFMMFGGVLIIAIGSDAASIIMDLLTISLILNGIKTIIYYSRMARFMVGGDQVLIRGLILLDLGAFTGTLYNISHIYIVGYLVGIHAFGGVIDVMHALEAKRLASPSWKFNLFSGIINIILAVTCLVFLRSTTIAVYIYGVGLIYSAFVRIITAFRKTAVVYITPS
ncbi:MAG: hypothetical protein II589_09235 [Clostridia bacterium]|nr:hypothetical protein [Clostridia bacterium]